MKTLSSLLMLTSLLVLFSAMPAAAQMGNGMMFETTFPFYAGNAKMPAGSYKITQPNSDDPLLLIESANGGHSSFLDCVPSSGVPAHPQSDVTFNKYGNTDYLNLLWIGGNTAGMQVLPSKSEELAAKKATATKHSVPAKKQ